MSNNLHKYYYKDYFSARPEVIKDVNDPQHRRTKTASINWDNLRSEDNNLILLERNKLLVRNGLLHIIDNPCANTVIPLSIQYPGLVTGIGINHETTIEGEFKLGVHFDWTWGMPVVYGSSVKGVLRSWFTEFYKGDIDPIDLMMEIFEGVYERDVEAEKNKHGENLEKKIKDPQNRIYKKRKSIYDRDIFFDAVITEADPKGRILCSDSITPHGDNPLKNPIPITFMKIAPGCELEFRFKLHDSDLGDGKIFTAAQKKTLFEEILKTVGVGAKTNVGYGQLK